MADSLTIDNYDISAHERWANDQELLEVLFFQESKTIPPHLEIAALEKSILSNWEQLFEFDSRKKAFAHFESPPKYTFMRNRFFNRGISEQFQWSDDLEDDDDKQKQKDENQAKKLKALIKKAIANSMPTSLFEKEQKALTKMIDSIYLLNILMREIHAKKLQYQKG